MNSVSPFINTDKKEKKEKKYKGNGKAFYVASKRNKLRFLQMLYIDFSF